jgi:rRNA maturation protein Nop10
MAIDATETKTAAGDSAPATRDTQTPATANRCRNCGAEATWNYCPSCGQETLIALPPAFTFLRDAAGRYIAFDGRMWRSFTALAFRPGFLTREYLAGRRRRYVRPARLFVALSIVVFAVLRFASGPVTIMETDGGDAARAKSATQSVAGTSSLGFKVDPDMNLSIDAAAPRWLAPLRARVEAFNRLSREEKADQVVSGMFRYAPYAAIGLLPLFALLLEVVYVGGYKRHPMRPRRYAAHLVFGAHVHAFAFLVTALFALLPYAPLRTLLVVCGLVYGVLALRGVYGGSWLGAVLRGVVVALAYLVLFALAMVALVVAAVTFR